jgi:hypothetical protein
MSKSHPGKLPQLSEGNTLHLTVERAITRGYATSWAEAYGVGLYLAQPGAPREAATAWLDYYGVPASKFFAVASLGKKSDDAGDVGV